MWRLQPPPEKSHPLFPSNLPLKVEVLSSPTFENLVGVSTPLQKGGGGGGGGGGAHYAVVPTLTLRGGWEEFYPHPQHSTPP